MVRWASFLVVVCVLAGLAAPARASSGGIGGYYGPSKTCMSCHMPPSMRQGSIALTSPVHVGKTYSFSFTCADTTGAGGSLPVAGVDIFASCGTLAPSPTEPKTKILGGELVHSQPVATVNASKTWSFSWTAPASPTSCGFTITGLLGNGDGKATGGDVTCMAMKALLVVPVPDAGPPDLTPPTPDAGPGVDAAPVEAGSPRDAGEDAALPREAGAAGDPDVESDEGCGCRLHRAPLPVPWSLLVLLSAGVGLARSRGQTARAFRANRSAPAGRPGCSRRGARRRPDRGTVRCPPPGARRR